MVRQIPLYCPKIYTGPEGCRGVWCSDTRLGERHRKAPVAHIVAATGHRLARDIHQQTDQAPFSGKIHGWWRPAKRVQHVGPIGRPP